MLSVSGKEGSGGSADAGVGGGTGGTLGGLISVKESKCAIFLLFSKKLLMNF